MGKRHSGRGWIHRHPFSLVFGSLGTVLAAAPLAQGATVTSILKSTLGVALLVMVVVRRRVPIDTDERIQRLPKETPPHIVSI